MNVFVSDFHPVRQCDRRAATKALCGEPAPMPYLVRVFRPHPSCAGKDGRLIIASYSLISSLSGTCALPFHGQTPLRRSPGYI